MFTSSQLNNYRLVMSYINTVLVNVSDLKLYDITFITRFSQLLQLP